MTGGGEGHDFEAAKHELLVPQLLEHPPDRLHERRVQRLVVVLKVDPPTHARDDLQTADTDTDRSDTCQTRANEDENGRRREDGKKEDRKG